MIRILTIIGALLSVLSACGGSHNEDADSEVASVDITNRRPLADLRDFVAAGRYAHTHTYDAQTLRAGMKVLFSASYGVGGEAGQSRGVLVERGGKLFYQHESNPTSQLLLAPGQSFNGDSHESSWDMTNYFDCAS